MSPSAALRINSAKDLARIRKVPENVRFFAPLRMTRPAGCHAHACVGMLYSTLSVMPG